MSLFLQALVGAIVWTFANLLYVDLKRKGVHSFARILAFWVGMPTTWLSLILVREGRQPRFERQPDDDASLLHQVRLDRARRLAEERRASAPGLRSGGAPPVASDPPAGDAPPAGASPGGRDGPDGDRSAGDIDTN